MFSNLSDDTTSKSKKSSMWEFTMQLIPKLATWSEVSSEECRNSSQQRLRIMDYCLMIDMVAADSEIE
jgi:hypothetical protein